MSAHRRTRTATASSGESENARMKLDSTEKTIFGIAALAIVIQVAFWGAVIYVAWHFISKLW